MMQAAKGGYGTVSIVSHCSPTATGGNPMQVLDTHVINSSAGTVIVEFKGEGSELVSVRIAGGPGGIDGDHAVLRAKEIMMQLAAFDDAIPTRIWNGGDVTESGVHSDQEPLPIARRGSHIRAD
jgi:hypothetical protein